MTSPVSEFVTVQRLSRVYSLEKLTIALMHRLKLFAKPTGELFPSLFEFLL
jgi:hypothetical protein